MRGSIIALVLSVLAINGAHATWYGEVSYGGADGSFPSNDRYAFIDVDNSDNRWQITGGYDVNSYFAVEISYANLGTQRSERQVQPLTAVSPSPSPGTFNPFTVPLSPNQISGISAFSTVASPINTASLPGSPTPSSFVAETEGLRLGAIAKVPLAGRFALHIHGGALVPRYKNTQEVQAFRVSDDGTQLIPYTLRETETSRDPEFFGGMGINMDLGPTFGIKLYWEKFLDVGNEDTFEQDIDTYNLGLRYHF